MKRRDFVKNTVFTGATALACGYLAGTRSATGSGEFLRPPGALDEDDFLSTCIRCGRCGDACPNRCITPLTHESGRDFSASPGPAESGTPVIFPRKQACMLCSGVPGDELLCTAACPTGALKVVKKEPEEIQAGVSMGTAVVDPSLCYSYNGATCGVCGRACPFPGKALKIGLYERPTVNPEFCIGCGLCERACIYYPQAIRVTPSHNKVSKTEAAKPVKHSLAGMLKTVRDLISHA